MKRTRLARTASLSAGEKPLARRTPLATRKALTTARDVVAGTVKKRPPRNTGPTAATRKIVYERARGLCERCGQPIAQQFSIHHRLARGMGGTKDPSANSPSNLVLLCGSATTPDGCHTTVERFRQAAITTGWIVPRTADPARTPVKFPTGRWYLLNPDGTLTPTSRPETQETPA